MKRELFDKRKQNLEKLLLCCYPNYLQHILALRALCLEIENVELRLENFEGKIYSDMGIYISQVLRYKLSEER